MSELIPEINWMDFVKIVKEGKIAELKACEVKFNSEYLFTAIIPHGDMFSREFIRTQAEYLSVKANIISGKDPNEIIKTEITVLTCPDCGFVAASPFGLSVHQRSCKEKVHAVV